VKLFNCLNCGTENPIKGIQYTNKYCNNKCQQEYQYKTYIAEWKQNMRDGCKGKLQTSSYIKKYILEKQNNTCIGCGIETWRGEKITLELDHIDGDSKNNAEYNLRGLCPNCHSLTPTYKSKNIGRGRKNR
jgi:hypothetical protein